MNRPLYVRAFTPEERRAIEAGLRSSDAFTLRRSQILLASAAGKRASQIGRDLHVDTDTALNAIRAFNERGWASLSRRSSRAHVIHFALPPENVEALKAILHQSPRAFDYGSRIPDGYPPKIQMRLGHSRSAIREVHGNLDGGPPRLGRSRALLGGEPVRDAE